MLYLYDLTMNNYNENSRRIAKNTLMLYFRMFFMMLLGLFTSRVVLEALGENDYGVYNVVGGVVAMFSIISASMSTAASRFITYELGKTEGAQLNKVYSTTVTIQFIISLLVVILAEPAGLWFIDNKMTIDPSRIAAARIVLHFTLLSFVVNLMSVPQMASITAHEKMNAYAYIGVFEGLLRFAIAIMISRCGYDRLILYSMLMAGSVILVRMAYSSYCSKNFQECRYKPVFDKGLFREMFSFAGWNFIGSVSGVLRDQGGNILVNIFSGPAVNAARGLAVQLNGAIQSFVTNFMTAVNPQITKSYASGDKQYMFSLMRKSSRMAFYLLFILALPVLFNTEYVMSLWLKEVPDHSVLFVRLFLIFTLSESISMPLITAMFATGKVRDYQIVVGGLQLLNLPISYALLKTGAIPEITVVVAIAISQVCLFARLLMLKKTIGLSPAEFLHRVYFNVIGVIAVAIVLPDIVTQFNVAGIIKVLVAILSAALSIMFMGCTRSERNRMYNFIKSRLTGKRN